MQPIETAGALAPDEQRAVLVRRMEVRREQLAVDIERAAAVVRRGAHKAEIGVKRALGLAALMLLGLGMLALARSRAHPHRIRITWR